MAKKSASAAACTTGDSSIYSMALTFYFLISPVPGLNSDPWSMLSELTVTLRTDVKLRLNTATDTCIVVSNKILGRYMNTTKFYHQKYNSYLVC